MHPVRRKMALMLAGLCLAGGMAEAQPRDQEVSLDVLATQQDGSLLVGLDKEDFIVQEDGRPVDVADVTFFGNHMMLQRAKIPERVGVKLDQVRQERYFILLFEGQIQPNVRSVQLHDGRQAAGKALHDWLSQLQPNDWVAVAGYDTKLILYQDFTRDPAALAAAVAAASAGSKPETPLQPSPADRPALLSKLPQGKALVGGSTTLFDALRLIGEAAPGITGRKSLVLITDGIGTRSRPPGSDTRRRLSEAVHALNAGNVAVYLADYLQRGSATEVMQTLAAETSGRYLARFVEVLQAVLLENAGYYLVRYHAMHSGKGFQKVQVTVTLPGAVVRTRSGYPYGR